MDERLFPDARWPFQNRDQRRSVLAPTWPWLLSGRQFQTNRAMRGAFITMIRDVRSVEEPPEDSSR
jgi:hypothetical protein